MEKMVTTRKVYTGSCHCGNAKYLAALTFPEDPSATFDKRTPKTISRIYKCNCTVCHKMAMFHVRLVDAPKDFVLLGPTDSSTSNNGNDGESPLAHLGDYTCNAGKAHWYFCPKCGVRVFTVQGQGEVADINLTDFKTGKHDQSIPDGGKTGKVWRLKKDGYEEGSTGYFSLNATTLDHDQEGMDLRSWHEKGWVRYLDEWRDELGWEKEPAPGGMY